MISLETMVHDNEFRSYLLSIGVSIVYSWVSSRGEAKYARVIVLYLDRYVCQPNLYPAFLVDGSGAMKYADVLVYFNKYRLNKLLPDLI